MLHPVERFLLRACIAIAAIDATLIVRSGVLVEWTSYGFLCAIGLTTIAIGAAYRRTGRSDRIASALLATGILVLFTNVASVLNYLLIPFAGARVDTHLIELDAYLGFEWRAFVERMSFHPTATAALGVIYASSLPQLAILVLVLGFGGYRSALHRFLLTGVFGALGAMLIWSVMPTSGPSAFVELPRDVLQRVWLVVEPSYGAELNRLMNDGPLHLSPKDTLGLIGFPSYHTVMALMSAWFIPRTSRLFWPIVLLNLAMLPAIVLHGGHHLVDVIAGSAMFLGALKLAGTVADRLERQA
jgi:hypothetical protein